MKREELKRIIEYVNDEIRNTISVDDSESMDTIYKGFFNEEEFINKFIVELTDN